MPHSHRRIAALVIAGITASLAAVGPASATTPGVNGPIAFRTYLDPDQTTSAIFTVRSDGTGLRKVTRPGTGTLDSQPDWSPHARLIAFERCAFDTVCAVYTVRPDGRQLKRLTAPCHAKPPALGGCADESGIAFMPDGRRVVFTRATGNIRTFANGDDVIEHSDLVIRDLSGQHARVVFRSRPFSGDNDGAVASPDGTRLAYQHRNSPIGRPGGGSAVFVVGVCGRHRHRITPWTLDAGDHPDWSPNGKWILFRSNESGNFLNSQLFIVHPDGTGMRQITDVSPDTLLLSASFSPDGKQIVYARSGRDGQPDIFTIKFDGAPGRQLTHTSRWDSAPDWGQHISHQR